MRYVLIGLAAIVIAVVGGWYYLANIAGEHQGPGEIQGAAIPDDVVTAREDVQRATAEAQGVEEPKQILFGDLHVHTTFSTDAFMFTLPMNGGSAYHPISDACDYARHCSSLDFWSINDHAEATTPRKWQETKDSIRQCNAVAGDPSDPDMVAFMGFEWTQVGRTPQDHYGHKNVVFRGLDDADISPRAIGAGGIASTTLRGSAGNMSLMVPLIDWEYRQPYLNFREFMREVRAVPSCSADTPADELSPDCYETADTPGDLARKLFDEMKLDAVIIPHGTSWGFYTPTGTTFDKQLAPKMHPESQTLIEVFSGHGNSEEYRPWRAVEFDEQGNPTCPAPSHNYVPSCWRAGEIIRDRCEAAGEDAGTCDTRAEEARSNFVQLGIAGHLTVKGESFEEYLDAGQCRDCFIPPFNHRPGTSVQYGLAISNFEDGDDPARFQWGFIGSSDNHRARPGTGYKPIDRRHTTESGGPRSEEWRARLRGKSMDEEPLPYSVAISQDDILDVPGFQLTEFERQGTFWTQGGLAAVHSAGRDRDAIFDALKRRETFATSGPRMLLWFDAIEPEPAPEPAAEEAATGGDDAAGADAAETEEARETAESAAPAEPEGAPRVLAPMGGRVARSDAPTFRVRAVGAFKQKPGCPDYASGALPAERLEKLCQGECYNPSDERLKVTRIEIIRISPQAEEGENVDNLIEDPWLTHQCPAGQDGCSFTFSDPEYSEKGRDTLYYARAIQEPTPAINGANLRCEYDAEGNCVKVNPCYGDYRTDEDDNCLADVEHRAWSSPIYVDWKG